MYTDLYLKFADEDEANSILYTVHPETVDEDGVTVSEEYTTPNYQNIDVLGIIYVDQPIPDPENPPTPIPEEGYHVNVRVVDGEDAEALEPFSVHPTLPRRVWG
jgi:hypothetical protein